MAISTLVIGVGGTGTLCVRALKKRYEETTESERVRASFLAIDFDRSALMGDNDTQAFAPLSEEDFLYLNPNGIQDLLRNIDRTHDGEPAWERVLRWLPDRERVSIPTSEVEANGASQLRALGRLGFFLNDELLETTLRRKLAHLGGEVDSVRLSTAKRVVLVSSLAGGTGGGMLLDMAYLARRQEGRPKVFLYLLLPEVFVDLDSGGRLLQNTYGFLKELAYLKDQQVPFNGDYLRIAPIRVGVGREEPFARLFLFSGTSNSGSHAIHDACQRMAGAILGQLHRTIQEKALAVASNTISGARAEEERRRRTHCFSTAGSSYVPLHGVRLSAETLLDYVAREVSQASEADLDADRGVREMFDAVLQRFDRLAESEPDASSASPERAAEPAATPGAVDGGGERGHPRVEAVVDNWKRFINRAVNANAGAIVDDLRKLLERAHLNLRAAAGSGHAADAEVTAPPAEQAGGAAAQPTGHVAADFRRDPLEAAQADLALLKAVALAEYTEQNYDANLKCIKAAAPAFTRYDANVREAVRTFFPALDAVFDVRQRQTRRQFFKSLDSLDKRFRAGFSEPSAPVVREIHAGWTQRERESQDFRHRRRRFWSVGDERLDAINFGYLDREDIARALQDESIRRHIADILRVRAYREWRARLDEARQHVEADWRDYRRAFDDLPGAERASTEIADLPGELRDRLRRAVRDNLPGIVEQARALVELDPPERRKQLVALIERVRRDVAALRDLQFHIDEHFPDLIRDALVRSRQSVFERRTPNPQRKGFTVMLVPYGLISDGRSNLSDFLASTATQILDTRCQVEHYSGDRIWIYYEDLFNPPEHLRNLDEYQRMYSAERFRELFHIDRRYLDDPAFREIHSEASRHIITCGNPECRRNIGGVPRTARLCPHCDRMIRSRCGNDGCSEENLQDHPKGSERLCPRCLKFNYGAWWKCERHGKVEYAVSIDKERCPRCIELHLADPVAYGIECISERPDVRARVQCPRCLDLRAEQPDHAVFSIPRELLRFYRDGVNGHSIAGFSRLAATHGLADDVRCPRCRTVLIPIHHRVQAESDASDPCASRGEECACRASAPLAAARPC